MNAECPRRDIIRKYFSAKSDYWASLYSPPDSSKSWLPMELSRRKDLVFDLIAGLRKTGLRTVLDIGCGPGHYIAQIAAMGFECTGADISAEMLEIARQKLLAGTAARVTLIQADCCALPLEDRSFDLILCIGLLEYLDHEPRALQEMKRLIKPGGFIIFTLPNLYKLRNLLNPYYYLVRIWTYLFSGNFSRPASGAQSERCIQIDYGKSTARRYSLFRARRLAADSGFRVVEVRSCCFGPFSLWKNEIFKTGTSIKISNALERLLSHKAFGFLHFFANRWVLLVQPEPSGQTGIP